MWSVSLSASDRCKEPGARRRRTPRIRCGHTSESKKVGPGGKKEKKKKIQVFVCDRMALGWQIGARCETWAAHATQGSGPNGSGEAKERGKNVAGRDGKKARSEVTQWLMMQGVWPHLVGGLLLDEGWWYREIAGEARQEGMENALSLIHI